MLRSRVNVQSKSPVTRCCVKPKLRTGRSKRSVPYNKACGMCGSVRLDFPSNPVRVNISSRRSALRVQEGLRRTLNEGFEQLACDNHFLQ